jgi:hypothetical protein
MKYYLTYYQRIFFNILASHHLVPHMVQYTVVFWVVMQHVLIRGYISFMETKFLDKEKTILLHLIL